MNIINNIADYIQRLRKKEFEKFLLITLVIAGGFSLASTYFTYNKSSSIIERIKKTAKLANRISNIINENKRMDFEENRLSRLFETNKNFDIKTFFEQFTQQQKLIPDPAWDTIIVPVEGNDNFEEIILTANFRNQTTANLTKMLDILDKNEMLYVKELLIKNEQDKQISFKITIATKRLKNVLGI